MPPPMTGEHPFEITHIQGRPSFAVSENAPKGCDQPIKFDRLGVELVASRRERLFALTGERMRGQRDDGDVAGLRTALEPPRGLPAIDIGHFEIHQDDVGTFAERHRAAPLAVLRRQHLKSPSSSSRILSMKTLSSLSST